MAAEPQKAVEPPTEKQIAEWYPRLLRTALRMTGRAEDAADLTQEAFCRAIGSWGSFNGRHLATTWLHRILVNCAIDWHRRQAAATTQELDEWALPASGGVGSQPSDQLDQRERTLRLRRAIDDLPETLRPAFVATVLDGYSYREAAGLLSVPPGTIAWRVHEAHRRLREEMRRAFPET